MNAFSPSAPKRMAQCRKPSRVACACRVSISRLMATSAARPGRTTYERDPLGRITKKLQTILDNPASPTVLSTSYAYTPAGELSQITYPSGLNVYYRRSATGQITSIDIQRPRTTALRAPAITPLVANISTTALNQPKSWSWNCITGGLYAPSISANCDSASRAFDADGRMTATEFASYSYDGASRITGIAQNLFAERTTTVTVGTATSIATELYTTPFTWAASYDNRGRLLSFNRPGSEQSYSYDANSNRLTSIAKKVSDTDIDGLFEASDRAATTRQTLSIEASSNKLLGFSQAILTQSTNSKGVYRTVSNVVSSVNYQLDANGNLTSDGLRSFQYDASNRLTEVDISKDGEAAKVTYLHNAQGQRVFKSEPNSAQTLPSETELGTGFVDWLKKNFGWLYATAQTNATLGTAYSYGESSIPSWALLGEYGNGGASSTGRTEYIWLPTDDGQAIPIGLFRNNRYYAIHSDHLGTPRLVKDDTAKPVWQWSYSAFGDNKPTGILKATTNPNSALTNEPSLLAATSVGTALNLRFAGQYFDQETGLAQNYMREYMSSQGRYTQADPIGLGAGFNRSVYVGANPLSFTDPMGLQAATTAPGSSISLPQIPAWIPQLGNRLLGGVGLILSLSGDTPKDQCQCRPATPENIRAVLSSSSLMTLQPTVSASHTQGMVTMMMTGGTLPPIQMDGSIIVDGNHRYIAGMLCNKPMSIQPWTAPLTKKPVPVSSLQIVQ